MEKDYAVVYAVAGMSKRFGGPKWFVEVGPNGENLVEYSINQALKAGFNKIFFIVGEHSEELFKEKFGKDYKGVPIFYAKQTFDSELRDKPWGTVDALCCIKDIIDCPFIFCNGDDIYGEGAFEELIKHLKSDLENSATLGYRLSGTLPDGGLVNRGIFSLGEDGFVKNITENFSIGWDNLEEKNISGDSSCSMNIFAFHTKDIRFFCEVLEKFKKENESDRKTECILAIEIGKLIQEGKMKMKLFKTNERWFGVTNPGDEIIVRSELLKLNNNQL